MVHCRFLNFSFILKARPAMMKSIFHGYFSLLCLAIAVVVVGVITTAAQEEECKAVRCPDSGPLVRFPFWLKGHQPKRCGYPHPNFQLSCSSHSNTTTTVLDLIYPVNFTSSSSSIMYIPLKYRVLDIDYALQRIYVSLDLESVCLPNSPPAVNNLSSSNTPPPPPPPLLTTLYGTSYYTYLSLWNCSSWNYGIKNSGSPLEWLLIGCLSGYAYKVVATTSDANDDILTSCEKMYDVRDDLELYQFGEEPQILEWSTPSCAKCEAQGNICRLNNNSTYEDPQIECSPSEKGTSKTWFIAVVVVAGTLVLLLVISSVLYIINRIRKKKEDQKKIEKFLDDYRALRPSRFSYADVKKITDNFKDKLGEGGYGTVYKGNLYNDDNGNNNSIPVAVKVLHNFKGNHSNNGEEFVNEVGTIGTIHHVNVVRLIGYCADGYRGALLYEFLPNGSLERLLSSRKLISTLGNWVKLRDIAIGVAKGLDYLHQGCNQRILHFDIKPQNILLDQNFNPKVSDFGLAKLCSKDQSAVSMTAARGTIGYIAPEVFSRNFGNVSYKSDVYSFGMLLVDMVGGRKTIRRSEIGGEEHEEEEDQYGNSTQMYFPEWMYRKLEKGDEIKIQIDNKQEEEEVVDEESVTIFKKLAMVGLWCIQWCPADRPSMKVAIQMLEAENLPAMPPNPFTAASRSKMQNAFMTSISEEIHESDIEIS